MKTKIKPYKSLTIRFDENLYFSLKKLSFLNERPMAELIRESLEKIIEEHKKVLTNSSIAV